MLRVSTELGASFVVLLSLLSPVLSTVVWSFLVKGEVAFMFFSLSPEILKNPLWVLGFIPDIDGERLSTSLQLASGKVRLTCLVIKDFFCTCA